MKTNEKKSKKYDFEPILKLRGKISYAHFFLIGELTPGFHVS